MATVKVRNVSASELVLAGKVLFPGEIRDGVSQKQYQAAAADHPGALEIVGEAPKAATTVVVEAEPVKPADAAEAKAEPAEPVVAVKPEAEPESPEEPEDEPKPGPTQGDFTKRSTRSKRRTR